MRAIFAFITSLLFCSFSTGCATHQVTLAYTDRQFKPPAVVVQPVLEGSINGVSGHFLIDTGATAPVLTQTAIQRCDLVATTGKGVGFGVAGKVAVMEATNVTIRLAQGVTVHLHRIPVLPKLEGPLTNTTDDCFGFLDYGTLAARGAVMDMKHKTITLTK